MAADVLVTQPQYDVTQNRELTIGERLMGQTPGEFRSHNWCKRRGAPMQRAHPSNQILSATSLQQISPDTVLNRATNASFIIELRDDENRTAQARVVRVPHTGIIVRYQYSRRVRHPGPMRRLQLPVASQNFEPVGYPKQRRLHPCRKQRVSVVDEYTDAANERH